MTTRQISISEFKAHCTEEIRQVEKGELVLELTRHGKTVAIVQSPSAAMAGPTLADWVGSGKGTVTFGPGYDPSAPAFAPDDWES
jgi:prevent-host-death family protein